MSDRDPARPQEDGSHVYDGIVEHDNKLPLWWQLTLYGAVVFALVYWFGRRMNAIPSADQLYAADVAVERAEEADRARARGTIDDDLLATLSRDPATAAKGKALFVTNCGLCHRVDGGGNIGPNLTDAYWIHGDRPLDLFKVVTDGVPAKGMPTWGPQLGVDRVETVVAYVLTLKDTNVPGGKAPQGELAAR